MVVPADLGLNADMNSQDLSAGFTQLFSPNNSSGGLNRI